MKHTQLIGSMKYKNRFRIKEKVSDTVGTLKNRSISKTKNDIQTIV